MGLPEHKNDRMEDSSEYLAKKLRSLAKSLVIANKPEARYFLTPRENKK
jgi:hypothetical protein